MTREEAMNVGRALSTNLTTYSVLDKRIKAFINEIYDDFKKRICQNCKYYNSYENNKKYGKCVKKESIKKYASITCKNISQTEVIGNIFENPELLEQEG